MARIRIRTSKRPRRAFLTDFEAPQRPSPAPRDLLVILSSSLSPRSLLNSSSFSLFLHVSYLLLQAQVVLPSVHIFLPSAQLIIYDHIV